MLMLNNVVFCFLSLTCFLFGDIALLKIGTLKHFPYWCTYIIGIWCSILQCDSVTSFCSGLNLFASDPFIVNKLFKFCEYFQRGEWISRRFTWRTCQACWNRWNQRKPNQVWEQKLNNSTVVTNTFKRSFKFSQNINQIVEASVVESTRGVRHVWLTTPNNLFIHSFIIFEQKGPAWLLTDYNNWNKMCFK